MSEEAKEADTMEVDAGDEANKSVMALSGGAGSISLSLHPLVIMNISEHWTRIRAQEGSAQQGFFSHLSLK
jgi:COP9 signalosome complex subunit 6